MNDLFLKALQKQGLTVTSASDGAKVRGWLHSGNYALNWAMSNRFLGGYPLGHVVEIFGDPSTGKSFLVARAIAEALNGGGVALLDDTERAFNPVWASVALGVDTQRLAYPTPVSETIEDHRELVSRYATAIKEAKVQKGSVLALDSLALLSTKHEMEHPEKADMTRAKEIKKLFRIMGNQLSDLPVSYIIANHKITNIGDMYRPETTPGGGGVKYQASIRIDLKAPKKLKSDKEYIGVAVRAFIDKNRFAPPWRSVSIVIPFHQAIQPFSGLCGALYLRKVLTQVEGTKELVYKGENTGIKTTKLDAVEPDFVKLDLAAQELLVKYPQLLAETDSTADNTPAPSLADASVTEEDPGT